MSSSKSFSEPTDVEVRQWLPPQMRQGDDTATVSPAASAPPTASELEALQQEAYDEGFEKGRQDGFEQGQRDGLGQAKHQMQQYSSRMEQLLALFSEPLRELDNQVEQELLRLVISIVRQLVRREIKSDPNLIIGVVREALTILPVASRNVRLLLHPEDAELIKRVYALAESEVGWTLIEDPVITRGGCKVVTDNSQIDATLDSRLTSLIAPLLVAARSKDEEQDEA